MSSPHLTSIPPEVFKQDRGPSLVIVIWVFAFLTLATVSIKVWTRCKILHRSGIEDLLMFLAWVLSVIYGALLTASVAMGLGKHPLAIDPNKIPLTLKLYTAAVPFGVMVLSLPTLAIAICLNNIIAPTKRQVWILYTFPILQIIMGSIGIILVFTQCKPPSTLWNPQPGARCLDKSILLGYVYFMSVYVAFVDVFLAIVPLMAFWQLQIKPKSKLVLCLMMSATTIAAICAFVRIAYVASLADVRDYTYSSIHHTLWAVIEGNVIIIAACLPGLRPFFKHACSRSFIKSLPSTPSRLLPDRAHNSHCPPPLPLGHRLSEHTASDASTSTPSPLLPRRMEPRPSGSVSGSFDSLNHRVYRQKSLERNERNEAALKDKTLVWQPGFGEGKEMARITEKSEVVEETRGRTTGVAAAEQDEPEQDEKAEEGDRIGEAEASKESGEVGGDWDWTFGMDVVEAVEVDINEGMIAGDEVKRRESQVQELREILEEGRAEARRSWMEKVRERVDKRMTI